MRISCDSTNFGSCLILNLGLCLPFVMTPVIGHAEVAAPTVETAAVNTFLRPQNEESVIVEVRAIKASKASSDRMLKINRELNSESGESSFDPRLEDLRSKLSKLQFSSFKLLSSQQAVVPLKKKQVLPLVNGQTLTVRPLYVEQQRIGLWLKWQDATGMDILDTRMHFDSDQSMLAGTDSAVDCGMVLAIDVKPAHR